MGNSSRTAVLAVAAALAVSLVLAAHAPVSSARQSRWPGMIDRLPYVFDSSRDQLAPLDPSSLRNGARSAALHLLTPPSGARYAPSLAVSPNGQWIASIVPSSQSNTWTVGIFDAQTGKERGTTYRIPWTVGISGLSNDARHLYGYRQEGNAYAELSLSAVTGRVERRVTVRDGCCGPALFDAAHHRFYVLMTAGNGHPAIGRRAPILVAYDLAVGRMVGRTIVHGVLAGTWTSNLSENGIKVPAFWSPGIALSPDGSQIAVFDGSNNRLTLINTEQMQVEQRITVSDPSTPLAGILGVLGLAPSIAEAKEFKGTQLNLQYSADGTLLYLSGTRGVPSHPHAPFAGLGLRVIDVASGHFQASAFSGKQLMWESSAPQGSDVYVFLPGPGNSCPCTLRRLNGATLQTEAQRTGMEGTSLYFLQPAASARKR